MYLEGRASEGNTAGRPSLIEVKTRERLLRLNSPPLCGGKTGEVRQ